MLQLPRCTCTWRTALSAPACGTKNTASASLRHIARDRSSLDASFRAHRHDFVPEQPPPPPPPLCQGRAMTLERDHNKAKRVPYPAPLLWFGKSSLSFFQCASRLPASPPFSQPTLISIFPPNTHTHTNNQRSTMYRPLALVVALVAMVLAPFPQAHAAHLRVAGEGPRQLQGVMCGAQQCAPCQVCRDYPTLSCFSPDAPCVNGVVSLPPGVRPVGGTPQPQALGGNP